MQNKSFFFLIVRLTDIDLFKTLSMNIIYNSHLFNTSHQTNSYEQNIRHMITIIYFIFCSWEFVKRT